MNALAVGVTTACDLMVGGLCGWTDGCREHHRARIAVARNMLVYWLAGALTTVTGVLRGAIVEEAGLAITALLYTGMLWGIFEQLSLLTRRLGHDRPAWASPLPGIESALLSMLAVYGERDQRTASLEQGRTIKRLARELSRAATGHAVFALIDDYNAFVHTTYGEGSRELDVRKFSRDRSERGVRRVLAEIVYRGEAEYVDTLVERVGDICADARTP